MKNKNFIYSIILFFSVLTIFVSCEEQKAEWQGTLEEVDGVTIVKNPKEPMYGEITFELEEDLSIGKENDENYTFFRVRGIQVDEKGNIFVLDRGNHRIQKFDREGRFLQTIGKKGQGPGEFEAPLILSLDSQNNLYAYDNRRIKMFNPQGEFLKSFSVDTFIGEFAADYEGSFIANASFHEGGAADMIAKLAIIKINAKGDIEKKIVEFSDFGPRIIVTPTATRTLASNHEYRPRLLFAALNDKVFIYAFSTEYQIILIDNKGNILTKIQKKESPKPITKNEKEFIMKRTEESALRAGMKVSKKDIEEVCHFSKYRTFFNGILTDDKMRIYVRRVKPVLDKSGEVDFDIFSRDGYYLYNTRLSFTPEKIRNGYMYDIYAHEETGEVKVKKYKIKNWEQIREGVR